jgi:misacylated tRNA(Ala) deacylase
MTILLYQTESYLREFEATVVGAGDEGVELDRTAFYPQGGGQPSDEGWLRAGEPGAPWAGRVVGVRKQGDRVLHQLEPGSRAPAVGERVRGEIDWERRYALMRTHTALHILCGVIFHEFGASVTGANMHPLRARMDFELEDLDPERIAAIERRCNEAVDRALPLRVRVLPRAEAFQIPDLIRTRINLLPPGIEAVRTVEIEGLDLQADGGTHVANTREVGRIRVVGTANKGRINKRIEIVVEDADG